MSRFREKLVLDPPANRIFQSSKTVGFVRFQDPKYVSTEADVWKEFGDAEWKWNRPGRYAGRGLNCGYYYSLRREAAVAEMNFYNRNTEWQRQKAEMEIRCQYDGILNLTERDSADFVFQHLLEFPYRRLSFQLALLASLSVGGNLLTDYIGGWAYHKGFQGVMFLSARALDPLRTQFDSSVLSEPSFAYYWTSMADDMDSWLFQSVEAAVQESRSRYLNVVFFNGPFLLSRTEKFSITHPSGDSFEAVNPHFGKEADVIMRELSFEDAQHRKLFSLQRMEKLQARVDTVCEDVRDTIRMHQARKISNQLLGSWMEDRLLSPDGILSPLKEI
jgi:hypothetical protein